MGNDESSRIRTTPGLENEYDFTDSRRSSTSLSLVGIGETPTELRDINNVYDRVPASDSPISPPVHPRCRSTTDFTTTQKSMQSTTPTPKFQCTRSQCPSKVPTVTGRPRSPECTPMCMRSPPNTGQQCRSPPQQCVPCSTKSPCTAKCATQSPCTGQASTQSPCMTKSPCTTKSSCTTKSPCTRAPTSPTVTRLAPVSTRGPDKRGVVASCPTRPSMPSIPNMYNTPGSPTYTTSSPTCTATTPTCTMRTTSRCSTGSPDCTARSPDCTTRSPDCTTRSPDCTTSTTPICTSATSCTPRTANTTPTCSPGVQSVDSRGAACPIDSCRNARRASLCCQKDEQQQQKLCPLDLCKMRAGLTAGPGPAAAPSTTTASASRSICSSPTSNANTKRVPFPSKKADDDSGGGVVRWTEKCSQRCKRPTWSSNRWNCDKPATRPCVDCTGSHPAVSRCAQDYDAHRFGAVDGRAMRKCDCCDKRSYPPMAPNQLPTYQTIDRGPPISNCGCDGFARGINHFRKPPVMPQNPFDNSSSAYFNRLHKGMPFSNQPPPPPTFNSMPQPPFNPPFNHPPASVSTVTTRDNSLNVLQDSDNFTSPMKSCGSCDPNPPDSPNQNINMVTNPHMFNAVYMPHNSAGSTMPHNNHNYM